MVRPLMLSRLLCLTYQYPFESFNTRSALQVNSYQRSKRSWYDVFV